jgi:hypothetical protein
MWRRGLGSQGQSWIASVIAPHFAGTILQATCCCRLLDIIRDALHGLSNEMLACEVPLSDGRGAVWRVLETPPRACVVWQLATVTESPSPSSRGTRDTQSAQYAPYGDAQAGIVEACCVLACAAPCCRMGSMKHGSRLQS